MLKLIALLAGCAGLAGFFLPLAIVHDDHGNIVAQTTPFQIATTEPTASPLGELAKGFGASDEQADRLTEVTNQSLLAYRGTIVAFYVPAALQTLLALFILLRGRMGRFVGFLAILFGAASGAVFVFFYMNRDVDPHATLGYGVWALAAAGAGGMLAGLITIFAPDDD